MNIDVMLNTAYLPTKEIKGSIKVDGSTCVPGIKSGGRGLKADQGPPVDDGVTRVSSRCRRE